jgi:UDP-3-O-[3-hydroxymyristoyl] glucosamine N-acyltransferase
VNATLEQIAALAHGAVVAGDPALLITGFSTVDEAQPGDVTFLGNARYLPKLRKSRASAVLAPPQFAEAPSGMAVIGVENPTLAFQAIVERFGPPRFSVTPAVHPSAVIGDGVKWNRETVFVGANAVIEDGAEIGDGCEIHPGAFIGRGARLGARCIIHANASIKHRCLLGNRVAVHSGSVIGGDGFGYELRDGRHVKIEQVGIVQIDDDVEVGSCTTVDRARFGRTWIGEGTKIDNLVQIAHNCVIGKHCIICGQVGISGSTRLGDFVIMAGQVGVAGHLTIGSQVTFLAKSGVTKDYPEPGVYTGYPAKPVIEGRRMLTYPAKVPGILERLRNLEERVRGLGGDPAQS